jgi:di/tricarboxylate transporter
MGEPLLWQQIFTVCLVVAVFVAFVTEVRSADLVAMTAFVGLILTGILSESHVAAVFGTGAPIVIACMFILSAALERTGVIDSLGKWFEMAAGKSEIRMLIVLMLLVAGLSGFVNNTPVVVVFLPIVLSLCRKRDYKASRFLIPLSYAAIAGGTMTIIGTSTNILASGIAHEMVPQMTPIGMFEIFKLGIVFVVIVIVYMMFVGRKLLPDRTTLSTLFEAEEGREFLTQAHIGEGSPLIGKQFTETPLAKMPSVRVIEVLRLGRTVRSKLPMVCFEEGDQLLFKSHVAGVMDVSQTHGLALGTQAELGLDSVLTESAILMEGILGPNSNLIGKSLKELNFRQRFGVLILAVHRKGENLRERFEEVKLAFGDTLLVEGPVDKMNALFAEKDFVNLSRPKQRGFRRSKAPLAIAALLLFLLLGSLSPIPIVGVALAAVLLVLLTGCLEATDAYRAVEWKVVFMIFGMLGLGLGLQQTQVVSLIAKTMVGQLESLGPYAVLAIVYLAAAVLTEIISNNAVAALLTPVAIGIAQALGLDPRPFVIAVMFGSSASFATPIGYQTNTYVYGAAGYRFGDFGRVGIPLTVVLWIVATVLIPIYWPFVSMEI